MRHFHLTRNAHWRPIINVDKLWSLVPAEEKKGITANSSVVPVIDTLRFGYGKVLGNGMLPKLPFIVKARFVSAIAECVSAAFFLVMVLTTRAEQKSRRQAVSSSSSHEPAHDAFFSTYSLSYQYDMNACFVVCHKT
jgi:hypothetical protein